MMKRALGTAMAVLVLGGAAALRGEDRKTLTLAECVDLGLKASKALRVSALKTETAEARVQEAAAGRLPSLKFSGGYTRLSEVPPFQIDFSSLGLSLPFALPGRIVVSPVFENNYSLKLSLQQPVYTGSRLAGLIEAARLGAAAADADFRRDRTETVFAVRSAYWNLVKAREFRAAVEDGLEQITAHLRDVRNFFNAGLLTRAEVLKVETQLASFELTRIEARGAVDLAGVVLASLIGLPLQTAIEPATRPGEPGEAAGPGASIDALIGKALTLRPELRALDLRIRSGQAGVTAAKSGLYPQVFLFGNFYYARPNPRILPSQDLFKDTWDFGVGVSYDISSGGQTLAQVRQAELQLGQARTSLEAMKDAIGVEVTQSALILVQARERVGVAERAVRQAEESHRMTVDRFRQGLALNADVLDAEAALLQARTGRVQALVDVETAKARLEKALGKEAA